MRRTGGSGLRQPNVTVTKASPFVQVDVRRLAGDRRARTTLNGVTRQTNRLPRFEPVHAREPRAGRRGPAGATASRGGCCIKPSLKSRSAFAEVHARGAERDDLASDRVRATDEMAVFGAHP
jgi:hypothetical protein